MVSKESFHFDQTSSIGLSSQWATGECRTKWPLVLATSFVSNSFLFRAAFFNLCSEILLQVLAIKRNTFLSQPLLHHHFGAGLRQYLVDNSIVLRCIARTMTELGGILTSNL